MESMSSDSFPLSDLISGKCILVQQSLAVKLGLNEAVVVQQLHFLSQIPGGREIDGKHWIFNTYEQWQKDHFPWWSIPTIKRIFQWLERNFIVESCQPDGHMSRKKYYRLNTGMHVKLLKGSLETPMISDGIKMIPSKGSNRSDGTGQNDPILNRDYSESTKQISLKKTAVSTAACSVSLISAVPKTPSFKEFDAFIEANTDMIVNHRSSRQLYDYLREHLWRDKKGQRIHDWKAYVKALDDKMLDAMVNS